MLKSSFFYLTKSAVLIGLLFKHDLELILLLYFVYFGGGLISRSGAVGGEKNGADWLGIRLLASLNVVKQTQPATCVESFSQAIAHLKNHIMLLRRLVKRRTKNDRCQ